MTPLFLSALGQSLQPCITGCGARPMSDDAAEEQADFASEEEEPVEFWDKVKHWTRQEHDGQWLSIAVFVGIAVLGAALITQAQVIPGYKFNPILDDYNLIDIAWNEDGTQALADGLLSDVAVFQQRRVCEGASTTDARDSEGTPRCSACRCSGPGPYALRCPRGRLPDSGAR